MDANTDKVHSFILTAPGTRVTGSTMRNTAQGRTTTQTGTFTKGNGHRTNVTEKASTYTRKLALVTRAHGVTVKWKKPAI